MGKDKRSDMKEVGRGLVLDTVLSVGSEAVGEAAKESITGILGDLAVDSASSLIPGVSGAIQGYKRVRFERNITTFVEQLYLNVDIIRANLETKTSEQRKKIDQLFTIVLDYVADEQQQEKIEYMVNGFMDLTNHEKVSEDFVLTYYDILTELRMVDISVLRLMYNTRYIFDMDSPETFRDVMERHGINYDQYKSVRANLQRIGLLVTRTDLNMTDDLEEIVKKFKELYAYLEKLTNPKYTRSLPKLKLPKLKSKENLELSSFGRDFVRFFIKKDD